MSCVISVVILLGIVPNEADPFKTALITVVSALTTAVIYLFLRMNKIQDSNQNKIESILKDQIIDQKNLLSKTIETMEDVKDIYREIREWLIKKKI